MKDLCNTWSYEPKFNEFQYFTENTLLYDIETTGLSKRFHQVYLIGCCMRKGDQIIIRQFFAESAAQEADILREFLQLASSFPRCITFNGLRFDEPFLKSRMSQLGLDGACLPSEHLDLYRECHRLKNLLRLTSCKQKNIEEFLGIHRKDPYDGGTLIARYQAYCMAPDPVTEQDLLLHNYEDVQGMVQILPILSYLSLLYPQCQVHQTSEHTYSTDSDNPTRELQVCGTLPQPLPMPLRIIRPYCYLILENASFRGQVRLFTESMYHYLPDYKKYVYLPEEDMVVLKELASGIDPNRKQKATADNCRIKKEGLFLQRPSELEIPENMILFQQQRKSKDQYLLYDPNTSAVSFLSTYINAAICS
jgi:hypothetical protein